MPPAAHTITPPRWDMSNVYPSLDSTRLADDIEHVTGMITALEGLAASLPGFDIQVSDAALAESTNAYLQQTNQMLELLTTIRAYVYSFITTDSFNQQAMRLMSRIDQIVVRSESIGVKFAAWVGRAGSRLKPILAKPGQAQSHAFFMQETLKKSRYLMDAHQEDLAGDLSLSGARAWTKLQGTVTSQTTVEFEIDGEVQSLPMPALINLRSHPDETIRRRAYEAEMVAWKAIEEPLAAAMNGIKGWTNTLNQRRGREDALHSAIDEAKIDRPTLEAMLGAMTDSLPVFRRYFKSKAKRLGKAQLAWWDLFAPMGVNHQTYTYDTARTLILANFARFSLDLEQLAALAFEHNWIDAEQRKGKRGGAFCMGVPGVKESRILCNFDGSLDQLSTIAHELGHAYHNECIYRAGKSILQSDTPMTMAETASIMCETIIVDAALQQAATPQDELAILESALNNDSQIIVDIYSRFLFEQEVFERREKADLSPDELCEIMERAQKAAYGDGLDERYLHKYMWTWKPHYYYHDLSFYNFPYSFGLLFGIGLYAIYRQRGSAFIADYQNLLASTGEASAADLAARFGIDIRQRAFWEGSLKVIGERVDRYEQVS